MIPIPSSWRRNSTATAATAKDVDDESTEVSTDISQAMPIPPPPPPPRRGGLNVDGKNTIPQPPQQSKRRMVLFPSKSSDTNNNGGTNNANAALRRAGTSGSGRSKSAPPLKGSSGGNGRRSPTYNSYHNSYHNVRSSNNSSDFKESGRRSHALPSKKQRDSSGRNTTNNGRSNRDKISSKARELESRTQKKRQPLNCRSKSLPHHGALGREGGGTDYRRRSSRPLNKDGRETSRRRSRDEDGRVKRKPSKHQESKPHDRESSKRRGKDDYERKRSSGGLKRQQPEKARDDKDKARREQSERRKEREPTNNNARENKRRGNDRLDQNKNRSSNGREKKRDDKYNRKSSHSSRPRAPSKRRGDNDDNKRTTSARDTNGERRRRARSEDPLRARRRGRSRSNKPLLQLTEDAHNDNGPLLLTHDGYDDTVGDHRMLLLTDGRTHRSLSPTAYYGGGRRGEPPLLLTDGTEQGYIPKQRRRSERMREQLERNWHTDHEYGGKDRAAHVSKHHNQQQRSKDNIKGDDWHIENDNVRREKHYLNERSKSRGGAERDNADRRRSKSTKRRELDRKLSQDHRRFSSNNNMEDDPALRSFMNAAAASMAESMNGRYNNNHRSSSRRRRSSSHHHHHHHHRAKSQDDRQRGRGTRIYERDMDVGRRDFHSSDNIFSQRRSKSAHQDRRTAHNHNRPDGSAMRSSSRGPSGRGTMKRSKSDEEEERYSPRSRPTMDDRVNGRQSRPMDDRVAICNQYTQRSASRKKNSNTRCEPIQEATSSQCEESSTPYPPPPPRRRNTLNYTESSIYSEIMQCTDDEGSMMPANRPMPHRHDMQPQQRRPHQRDPSIGSRNDIMNNTSNSNLQHPMMRDPIVQSTDNDEVVQIRSVPHRPTQGASSLQRRSSQEMMGVERPPPRRYVPPPPPPRRSPGSTPPPVITRQGSNVSQGLRSSPSSGSSSPGMPGLRRQGSSGSNLLRACCAPPMIPMLSPNNDESASSSVHSSDNDTLSTTEEGPIEPINSATARARGLSDVINLQFSDRLGGSGLYSGEIDQWGRPHGRGKMKYVSGKRFKGQWNNGMPNMVEFQQQQNNPIPPPGSSSVGAGVPGMMGQPQQQPLGGAASVFSGSLAGGPPGQMMHNPLMFAPPRGPAAMQPFGITNNMQQQGQFMPMMHHPQQQHQGMPQHMGMQQQPMVMPQNLQQQGMMMSPQQQQHQMMMMNNNGQHHAQTMMGPNGPPPAAVAQMQQQMPTMANNVGEQTLPMKSPAP